MAKVKINEIREKVERIFRNEGVDENTAKTVTTVLIDTEMKGVKTHGLLRVPYYVECLRSGGILPEGDIEVITDTPSMALVSGKGGLGIAVAEKATKLAVEKAKNTGIGVISVRGSHHLGAVGYYAEMCAKEGMIGIAMSNGNALIAPTGARKVGIGNNPFSYAVPAGKYGTVLYDIAMSMGSDMKVHAMYNEGRRAPEGWFLDKNGKPSTDPVDYINGGVLVPFGGYKGYGLAVMVEMMAALLSGAATTHTVKAWNKVPCELGGNVGHFIMALDISKLTDLDDFVRRAEDLITELKGTELADGADKIYYPGEKEKDSIESCMDSGLVEVADDTLARIEELLGA